MGEANPSVLVIDDDPEFRDSVARLLRTVRLETRQFSSVSDFLKADPAAGPTCLVLDVRMPGRSGLELQRDLAAANRQVPIIFITAHADVAMTVQAMKGGAIEFLTKPFRDQDLLDAVEAGLARDRARRESERVLTALRERFDTLSSREREIMLHVVAGRLNKQIANDIGIAESTVKVHRTHLMRKMKAPFASRAQPDGGHSQRETTAAAELLSQPKGYRPKRFHASALSLRANYHLLHLLQR
jgi:FixJ family two-component response regulator